MATVLLVEYPLAVQQALRSRLAIEPDLAIVGVADDGAQAIALAQHLTPDVVLVDAEMPDLDCVHVVRTLEARGHASGIVVLTLHGARVADALQHTSAIVVGKYEGMAALFAAVRAAAQRTDP